MFDDDELDPSARRAPRGGIDAGGASAAAVPAPSGASESAYDDLYDGLYHPDPDAPVLEREPVAVEDELGGEEPSPLFNEAGDYIGHQDQGRRTVVITGHGDGRHLAPRVRDRELGVHSRVGLNPDRVAMWAVLLGVVLILVAAASAHA